MIVSDDKEYSLPALMARDAQTPVVVGRMLQVPCLTVPIYAALFMALGWFGGEQWRDTPAAQKLRVPVAHAARVPLAPPPHKALTPVPAPVEAQAPLSVDDDNLPALRYSAHVYASSAEKRSIVLNGQPWKEGESPLPNLVIEQIQQDVTVFSFNGKTFTLAALDDWPGGIIADSPQGE